MTEHLALPKQKDSNECIAKCTTSDNCEGELGASQEAAYGDHQRRKLMRRIDMRMIPCLTGLYGEANDVARSRIDNSRRHTPVFSYIDRANIGNAKIEGMAEDLKLTGGQYNIVLSVFFVTYIVFGVFCLHHPTF